MEPVQATLHRTAAVISSTIGSVFEDLEKIAAAVSEAAASASGVPRRSAFHFLKKEFANLISQHSGVIIGAGIAYAPGSLPEARNWLEWWRVQHPDTSREARFVTHDLNPDSLNYYDYASREWFTVPSASGKPVAVGPYVDFGGINVNIITLCVPAATPQGTHVLGGDLTLAKLEGAFLQALQLHDPSVVLLGPNGRVIASNDARIASGTLLRDQDVRRVQDSVDVSPDNPTRLPWKLISLRK
ncbi:PDC sensor domain-containing protein [Pseudarthrobacter sp. NS4]|uniref:PDC sensor domain-containing protein n=1 Tax=Pseudarthrobacter sp. NS4 TaxID=2973976 RepID=UPI002161F49A|nr:hypothetical protein [Pseudarthrobacter sp. NS4]